MPLPMTESTASCTGNARRGLTAAMKSIASPVLSHGPLEGTASTAISASGRSNESPG